MACHGGSHGDRHVPITGRIIQPPTPFRPTSRLVERPNIGIASSCCNVLGSNCSSTGCSALTQTNALPVISVVW